MDRDEPVEKRVTLKSGWRRVDLDRGGIVWMRRVKGAGGHLVVQVRGTDPAADSKAIDDDASRS